MISSYLNLNDIEKPHKDSDCSSDDDGRDFNIKTKASVSDAKMAIDNLFMK